MKLKEYIELKSAEIKEYSNYLSRYLTEENLELFIKSNISLSIAKNSKYHNIPAVRFLISQGVDFEEFFEVQENNILTANLVYETYENTKENFLHNKIDEITLLSIKFIDTEVNLNEIYSIILQLTELKTFTQNNSIYRNLSVLDILRLDINSKYKHKYIKHIIDNSYHITEAFGTVFYFIEDRVVLSNLYTLEEFNLGDKKTINNVEISLTVDGIKILDILSL